MVASIQNGKVTYQGGDQVPVIGTQEYNQAASGIIPAGSASNPTIPAGGIGTAKPLNIPSPYGTSTTLALQQNLNQKNANAPGYVPLKLDGIYGPLTDAATKFATPAPADTTTTTNGSTTTSATDPILDKIKQLMGEQDSITNQIGDNQENSQGLFGGAVEQNGKILTAKNDSINNQVKNLEDFYKLNQDSMTTQQKADMQAKIDSTKASAADLTSAKEYAYKAAVKAGDSADVLNKIATATTTSDVYGAIQGNSTYTGTPSKTQVSIGAQKLEASVGADGYVDPAVYQKAYKDWIGSGFAPEDFLKQFPPANWVNPANTWLPVYLRPKASTSSGSSGSRTL